MCCKQICPKCNGKKIIGKHHWVGEIKCNLCDGFGYIYDNDSQIKNRVEKIKSLREQGICPVCCGDKQITLMKWDNHEERQEKEIICPYCKGKGRI